MGTEQNNDVRDKVREGYSEIAKSGQWSGVAADGGTGEGGCCGGGGCCGPTSLTADDVAKAVGYADADLQVLPDGANMGLSCGNPTALASLSGGEVVLDLGSGGGFDCFIAGAKVGESGRVIGVDMTGEMLSKARANIAGYTAQSGLSNVEFRLGEIENIPVADGSVDVVISNCVLNLSPDKARVWREIVRVLKPGGRVAISDLALVKALPEGVRDDLESLVGCIAGAPLIGDIRGWAASAGLDELNMVAKPQYVEAFVKAGDPLYEKIKGMLGADEQISDYVVSLDISAKKACCAPGCC
jgi:SAM-dependent methyltransferase